MPTFASLLALASIALAAPIPSASTNPASELFTSITASTLPSSTVLSVSTSLSSFGIASLYSSSAAPANTNAMPSFSTSSSVMPRASTTLSTPIASSSVDALRAPELDTTLPSDSALPHETDTKTRERLLACTSSFFDEIKALSPESMQQTLSAFKPELTALAVRYASSWTRAAAAGLHTPYSGQAPGEQALLHSWYALETHLAQAQADAADNAACWTWYTTVFVNMVRDDMLWTLDNNIALEHLIRVASDTHFSAESIESTSVSAFVTPVASSTLMPTSPSSITDTATLSNYTSLL